MDEQFPKDDTRFLYRYNIVPAHAKVMVYKLLPVVVSDGAHLKNGHKGTMFGTWGIDSNNQIACLCLSVYFDNECTSTWKRHLNAVKKHLPEINSQNFCMISGNYCYAYPLLFFICVIINLHDAMFLQQMKIKVSKRRLVKYFLRLFFVIQAQEW